MRANDINLRILLATASFLICAPLALAADPNDRAEAVALYRRGLEQYDARDYEGAISSFEASYALSRAQRLIFNVAQAYRLLGDCSRARRIYRAYLQLERSGDARRAAENHLGEDSECREPSTRRSSLPHPHEDAWIDALEQRVAVAQSANASELQSAPLREEVRRPGGVSAKPPGPARWLWIGGGSAGVAAGGVLIALAIDRHQLLTNPNRWSQLATPADARRAASAGNAFQISGGILAASGLGAILVGTLLSVHLGGPDVRLAFTGTGAVLAGVFP